MFTPNTLVDPSLAVPFEGRGLDPNDRKVNINSFAGTIEAEQITARKKLVVTEISSMNGEPIQLTAPLQTVNVKQQSRVLTSQNVAARRSNGTAPEQYDIIICGAGTAGSLLVYRLAQQFPTKKILLLEAGKDDVQDDAAVRTPQDGPNPNKYDPNPLLTDDWGQAIRGVLGSLGEGAMAIQQTQRSLSTDQYIPQQKILGMARGMTLGGTSAVNVQLWNRGTKVGTYDKWETAVGTPEFGWTAMNQSYKAIENRGQTVRYYGTPIPRWLPASAPVPPGKRFDPATQGTGGRVCLTQDVLPGYTNEAVRQCAIAGFGGRTLPVDLNAEDPANPPEYIADLPSTNYDQSDPAFGSFNPYPATTPGLSYVPPNPLGTVRDGSFAGLPAKLDGTPVVPGQANLKKLLVSRCFAAPAFIYPLIYPVGTPAVPNNVTIKTKCYVTKLLFSDLDPTECIGVEYVENGWHVANVARAIRRDVKPWVSTYSNVDRSLCTPEQAAINRTVAIAGGYKRAYAAADVWLCAGALDSPAIMQRSGIGSKQRLESLNYSPVQCRLDLPGVGANLQDTCDLPFAMTNEIDWNTYLPAYTGAPASAISTVYKSVFGLADPASPADPIGSSSIAGAPVGTSFETSRMRLKSSPGVPYFDCDILMGDVPINFVPFGNNLWGDLASLLGNTPTTIDCKNPKFNIATFDRSSIGQYNGNGSLDNITTAIFNTEFWNLQSKGEVMITSGDPFDRPNYAPNMLANENDLDIVENHFVNNIIPLVSKLSLQKRGPRGPITYAGIIGTGAHVATTTAVQLLASVATSLFKPFAPAYIISQGQYDTAGSLVGATLTMANGPAAIPGNNQRIITAWSGNTGVAATSYVATVAALGALPVATNQYGLARANELPLDSVEFTDYNHRNAVRFFQPNGDSLFSDINKQTLSANPITTYAGSTRLTFAAAGHGFAVGEMIKISGVTAAVDTIPAALINDYHFVTAVPSPTEFEIAVFWNLTALPGTAGTPPTANPCASVVGTVGVGGAGIVLHTLKFDRYKFREVYQYSYFSGWHSSSTCRMGKPSDSMAVVDTRARVYGTLGLRVCDASILPTKPDGNTQAQAYGVAQRLFELVAPEYQSLL